MKKEHKLTVTLQAELQILDAFEYYEFSQPGLGDYFLFSLGQCFKSVQNNPEIYKVIFKHYRQAKLRKFPYVAIYMV